MEPHRGTPAAYQPHAENPRRPEGSSASPRIQQTFQTAEQCRQLAHRVSQHLQNGGPSNDVVDSLESLESDPMTPKHRVQRCPGINHEKHVADIRCQQ